MFGTSGQELRKNRYQSFLALSSFAYVLLLSQIYFGDGSSFDHNTLKCLISSEPAKKTSETCDIYLGRL